MTATLPPLSDVIAKATAFLKDKSEREKCDFPLSYARLLVTCPESQRRGYAQVAPDGTTTIQWCHVFRHRGAPSVTECRYEDLEGMDPKFPSEVDCIYDLGPDAC